MTESQSQPPSNAKSAFKPLRGIFVIILAVTAVVAVSKLNQPKEIIPWRTDWTQAMQEAKDAKKPIFAYFTATWCGPCQELKHTLWADPQVEAALRNYIPVKIDVDENPALTAQYRAIDDGIPSFYLLDNDGRALRDLHGAVPSEDMLKWLKG